MSELDRMTGQDLDPFPSAHFPQDRCALFANGDDDHPVCPTWFPVSEKKTQNFEEADISIYFANEAKFKDEVSIRATPLKDFYPSKRQPRDVQFPFSRWTISPFLVVASMQASRVLPSLLVTPCVT
ncbi:hypothetical protein CEXT_627791 [Caerostris extrusa]|uniref:Uncharacterized protein n=1 Tax=Caerostris extrusa TaxID=172846 RepID=A0AAV4XDG0_CAEEX|nr:hypothetical protein CEXT_627791 [Caerostris extrusa]